MEKQQQFSTRRKNYSHLGIYFTKSEKDMDACIVDVMINDDALPDSAEVLVLSQELAYDGSEEAILKCVHWFRKNAKEYFDQARAEDEAEHFFLNTYGYDGRLGYLTRDDDAQPITKREQDRRGYVYVLCGEDGSGPVYKIGRTKNKPIERMAQIGARLPFEVGLFMFFEADDMVKLEATLHAYFRDKRLNGEWFRLDDGDIAYLTSLGKGEEEEMDNGQGYPVRS